MVFGFLRTPDFVFIEQQMAFISKEIKSSLEAYGLRLDETMIETPVVIEKTERYHAPLKLASKQSWKVQKDILATNNV